MNFEANQGQIDDRLVKFLSRGSDYSLLLTATEARLTVTQPRDAAGRSATAVVRMTLVGASSDPDVIGRDEVPTKSHYFMGSDPTKWQTDIPNYAKVEYQEVYPGVDLVYYGNQRRLEYDFALVHNSRSRSIIALHPRDPRSCMTSFKRTQRKYVQKTYRVRNWQEYETGLRARGSLTVWLGLTDGKLANWNSPRPKRRKPGRPRQYSNHAIETTVTLGVVFGLASRQTEGFLRSLLTLLNLDNDVPDHTTISRRKARLGKVAFSEQRTVTPVHLLIDSSGLSVHVGQRRTPPNARDYRKLHLAVDEHTGDVVACELTSKRARDASRVASLVGQIERPIASATADAAYDTGDVYEALENHRADRSPKVLIPPRKGAQLAIDSAGTRQRNRNIRARSRVGKRKWHVASGYSMRSKVETTFHRYKAILGSAMRARGLASQRVEVRLGCKILNTMTALGTPDGEMTG